jgi:cytidylate kinase
MTVDGLPLRLRQDEPFVIAVDGHPVSGQVTASDKQGARLQIEALRRRYAYRFFRPSNDGETADAVSESKPYGSR